MVVLLCVQIHQGGSQVQYSHRAGHEPVQSPFGPQCMVGTFLASAPIGKPANKNENNL